MRYLKRMIINERLKRPLLIIVQIVVYSNIWISVGAVALTYLYFQIFAITIEYEFLVFLFCATFFTYNFQRLVKLTFNPLGLSGFRLEWTKKYKNLIIYSTIISGILLIILGYQYVYEGFLMLLIMSLFSFFYVWKIPFTSFNLRNIPGIKIYIVAITWLVSTVLLPNLLFNQNELSSSFIYFALGVFLFMVGITIPFDIRDLNKDDKEKKTIPQVIGIVKSKYAALFLIVISHLFIQFASDSYNIGIIINLLICIGLIWNVSLQKTDLYFSGGIDSLLVTLLLLYSCF